MARTVSDRNKAKELYCVEGKKIKEISTILAVPEKTLYKWKHEGEWDSSLKQSGTIGMAIELQKCLIKSIQDAIENQTLTDPATSDALYKSLKLMEKLLPKKVMLANIFNMIADITNYLKTFGNDSFLTEWMRLLPEISDFLRKKYND